MLALSSVILVKSVKHCLAFLDLDPAYHFELLFHALLFHNFAIHLAWRPVTVNNLLNDLLLDLNASRTRPKFCNLSPERLDKRFKLSYLDLKSLDLAEVVLVL